MLICSKCANKAFTDGSEEDLKRFVEVRSAPIQKKKKDFFEQTRKFKCQKCGYIFHISRLKADENKTEDSILDKDKDLPEIKW